MQNRVLAVAAIAVIMISAIPATPHHSNSAYQVDEIITLVGVVKEWRWSNPHTWLYLMVEGENGEEVEWAVEGRAPGVLGRAGWDRAVLSVGETVTVHASPAKDRAWSRGTSPRPVTPVVAWARWFKLRCSCAFGPSVLRAMGGARSCATPAAIVGVGAPRR